MSSRAMLTAIGITLAYLNTVGSSSSGCLVGSTWLAEGANSAGGEACLRCTCRGGALACARRACAAAPDPPPPRCHTLHRKGACCPELHCPDSITSLEHGASARFEMDDFSDMSGNHGAVCLDGGTAYSAGSAMKSHVACEQCFCLRGARRCVRPACLAPPPGCRARPSSGACCPQRYYCDHSTSLTTTTPTAGDTSHDCFVNGLRVPEGERVPLVERQHNCTQCFCLRGLVKCQHLACAPPLLGCQPILRPGECCPHKYHCHHDKHNEITAQLPSHNKNDDNSPNSLSFQMHDNGLQKGKSVDNTLSHSVAKTNALKTEVVDRIYSTTNKVKRKTNESVHFNKKPQDAHKFARFKEAPTTDTDVSTTDYDLSTESSFVKEPITTDQPETMVKILINGTINCTTVLASSDSLDTTDNESKNNNEQESLPRIPSIDRMDDDFNPDDLITDKYVSGAFDENDSFTVNVTSSLRANTSHPIKGSVISIPKVGLPVDLIGPKNGAKKKKGDYDYDYNEPTLPPSLPNLKIIPFVAADAVVDEAKSNEPPTYALLEREDKHPIYYPQAEKSQHANRREDVYAPSQYPIYTSVKSDSQYGPMPQLGLPGVSDLSASLHEYAVSATLGNRPKGSDKAVTSKPSLSSSLDGQPPEDSLFSPPMETEGGFVPKGPGLIDEYYAVYPSTPAPLHAPQLTTSMQLDPSQEDCVSSDGRRIAEGDTISMKCSVCACAWGELHCSPRPCLTPPGCQRRPPTKDSKDICCGDIACGIDKRVSTTSTSTTTVKPPATTSEDTFENYEEEYQDEQNEEHYLPDITTAASDNISQIISTAPEMSSSNYENVTAKPSETKQDPIITYENITYTEQSVANITDKLSTIANVALATQSSAAQPNISRIHPLEEFLITHNETVKPTAETKTEETFESETNEPQTQIIPQDYEEEEEEDDDEGFSFGSVLKLLLSDSYDSTPKPQERKTTPYMMTTKQIISSTPSISTTSAFTTSASTTTSAPTTTSTTTTTTTTPKPVTTTKKYIPSTIKTTTTTKRIFTKPTVAPFRPMPQHQLYAPQKNYFSPTSVNKIDHLVLGEATAIRKTSSKPSTLYRPLPSTLRPITLPPTLRTTTTKKPVTYPNSLEITQGSDIYTSVAHEGSRPFGVTQGALPGSGLLKLAGCNIYGKMYRVGRIIAELSSDCQECRCTEIGVQCRDLNC